MDLIRYKPGEAIRWIHTGAEDMRKQAMRQGKSVIKREGDRTIGKDIKDVASALVDMGKSTWAEVLHKQAEASEYVLHADKFDVVSPGKIQSVRYDEVVDMKQKGDRVTVILKQGSITIKPHAYILVGKLKAPVGWARNGLEVAYETLLDELSARCKVNIEYL